MRKSVKSGAPISATSDLRSMTHLDFLDVAIHGMRLKELDCPLWFLLDSKHLADFLNGLPLLNVDRLMGHTMDSSEIDDVPRPATVGSRPSSQ